MSRPQDLADELIQEAPQGARYTVEIMLRILAVVLAGLILIAIIAIVYVLT